MIWERPLATLKGVGPKRAAALEQRGLCQLLDLLLFFPLKYSSPPPLWEGEGLPPRGELSLVAHVLSRRRGRQRRGGGFLELSVAGPAGPLAVRFYNQAWLYPRFPKGTRLLLWGRLESRARQSLVAAGAHVLGEGEDPWGPLKVLTPRWPVVSGLARGHLGRILGEALKLIDGLEDPLPPEVREGLELMGLAWAFRGIHAPSCLKEARRAQERLLFDRFLALFLPLAKTRGPGSRGISIQVSAPMKRRILSHFPFRFTTGQQSALDEILTDLGGSSPMSRLLEGDVGSGKTAVALAAALAVVAAGWQVLFLAPTEPLVLQHARVLDALLEGSAVRLGVLRGRLLAGERRALEAHLAAGRLDILLATHAVLGPRAAFHKLGLVIIDEQQRFGVRQRLLARAKGRLPHLLAMSATPIPRSLCLALMGDLDHSLIRDFPGGRRRVPTRTVSLAEAVAHLGATLRRGEQAYVVFPSIEARDHPALLREGMALVAPGGPLCHMPHGVLHGRLSDEARAAAQRSFQEGRIKLLLATSMVEVGLDVPEATLMVVVGAERFGLAALHQLRGRVGRGQKPSVCLLIPGRRLSFEARQRLKVLEREQDGFRIADQDLSWRGPGELLGFRQSGGGASGQGPVQEDGHLFDAARMASRELLKRGLCIPGKGGYYDLLAGRGRRLPGLPEEAG